VLLCTRDPRFFDLLLLWGRTRLPALLTTLRHWRASSYTPLLLDLPDARGRRGRSRYSVRGFSRCGRPARQLR